MRNSWQNTCLYKETLSECKMSFHGWNLTFSEGNLSSCSTQKNKVNRATLIIILDVRVTILISFEGLAI